MSGYTINTRLSEFLSGELHYLSLKFDEDDRLARFEGNAEFYGIDVHARPAKTAGELLPFLAGIDVSVAQHLPYIEFIDNIVTDIYLYPDNTGFEVILLETGAQHHAQQAVQQQANENAILHYRLKQLTEELRQKNILLEKANRAKSEFIATVSHELKTPLASILGYAELLDNFRDEGEINAAASAISRSGSYLLSLIDNLLEQGRVDSGQVVIQKYPCAITSLLSDIQNIIQPLAQKKQLAFRIENNVDGSRFNIDEQHVKQVLINLLTNAVKYTEEGHIMLSVDYANANLTFKTSDTGIGIPAAELNDVMLPFKRASHQQTTEGIGLGLSVSHRLAELMDGNLEITSTTGKGTTVTFTIPATRADQQHHSVGSSRKANQVHILLVEDDADLSALFETLLTGYGFHASTVSNREDLLHALQAHHPDIILMDHNINGQNGLDMLKEINKKGYTGKTILVTASPDQSLVDQAAKAGCCDFLQKPVTHDRLIETIQSHLE